MDFEVIRDDQPLYRVDGHVGLPRLTDTERTFTVDKVRIPPHMTYPALKGAIRRVSEEFGWEVSITLGQHSTLLHVTIPLEMVRRYSTTSPTTWRKPYRHESLEMWLAALGVFAVFTSRRSIDAAYTHEECVAGAPQRDVLAALFR